MSRAFIKEDAAIPEPEAPAFYRVYWGLGRHDIEFQVLYSSACLLDAIQWALAQKGYYQIRDADNIMLAEIDTSRVRVS